MDQVNEARIVLLPAIQAVGMRWEGTFEEAQAGGIRRMMTEFRTKLGEIRHMINSGDQLGLSYHACPGGKEFTHYSAVEVARVEEIPDGMASVRVPALTYARCEHQKGQDIDKSYQNLYAWIEQQGYAAMQGDLTHFEIYPMSQDPYEPDPAFVILIPIEKK